MSVWDSHIDIPRQPRSMSAPCEELQDCGSQGRVLSWAASDVGRRAPRCRLGRPPGDGIHTGAAHAPEDIHPVPPLITAHRTRTLAEHLGLSATTIRRVWRRNGIKPHLTRTFKLSRDPRFER